MKSLSTLLGLLLLGSLAIAQTPICPFVINTDSVLVSGVQYQIETIEPGQSTGTFTPAPMTGLCIDAAALPPVSAGGTYRVYPEKNTNPRNGVSTLDIVKSSRHILNINPIDLYQQFAADVDGNLLVDVNDLSLTTEVILYLITEFPVPSWQFVDSDVMPSDLMDLQKNYIEFDAANPPTIISFYGVKSGDVTGNSNPFVGNVHKATDRSSGELVFEVEDRMVEVGETITVDFLAKNFTDLSGYQFTLDFAADFLEFQEQQDIGLPTDYLPSIWNEEENEQGKMPTLWISGPNPLQIQDGTTLFRMTFKVLQNGRLSDLLSASGDITANVAYTKSTSEILSVALDFSLATSLQETNNQSFVLSQNHPNPVVQSTTIPFELAKATEVTLVITDALGRQINSIQTQGTAGKQAIKLDRSDFGAAGLYHYTLITPFGQNSQVLFVK